MSEIENYFDSSVAVKELKDTDFDEYATSNIKNKHTGMVLYYAPWCGYCKRIKQDYERAAKISLFCDFFAFNCEKNKHHYNKIKQDTPELIQGFPTIILYKNGEPYEKFDKERTVDKFLSACMEMCK